MTMGLKRKPEAFLQAYELRKDQQLYLPTQQYKSSRGLMKIVYISSSVYLLRC